MLALALISPIKGLDVCCMQLGKLQFKLLYLHVKAILSGNSAIQSLHEAIT